MPLDRKEFIKLTTLIPFSHFISLSAPAQLINPQQQELPNILIIVYDAFSAYHASPYGYARETMPRISNLLDKAIVYHNHYAGGVFTTPGTASLLTGTLPWTHRAIELNGSMIDSVLPLNAFKLLDRYNNIGLTHNRLAEKLLNQMISAIDTIIPSNNLLIDQQTIVPQLFSRDLDIAELSWIRTFNNKIEGSSYSLYLYRLIEYFNKRKFSEFEELFPRGLPYTSIGNGYFFEDATTLASQIIKNSSQPFFGYFHFYPPHHPYSTRKDFIGTFENDGLPTTSRPSHLFQGEVSNNVINRSRDWYDELILYVDIEFERLYKSLANAGILDNTVLIFTSDHGEMFQNGYAGHLSPLMLQPVVNIPLIIFDPTIDKRVDIFQNTSAVDILPTILNKIGDSIPRELEGTILPPYSNISADKDRSIFALEASGSDQARPLGPATAMIIKGDFKLVYYFGYPELGIDGELIEFFDISKDPLELYNLYSPTKSIAQDMLQEIKSEISRADEKYST